MGRTVPARPLAERFWEKVERSEEGCWIWRAARGLAGAVELWGEADEGVAWTTLEGDA